MGRIFDSCERAVQDRGILGEREGMGARMLKAIKYLSLFLVLFVQLFLPSAALGDPLGGWRVEKYQAEENEIIAGTNLYQLVPPDDRAPIIIREAQAQKILAGKISPAAVYRNREGEKEPAQIPGEGKSSDSLAGQNGGRANGQTGMVTDGATLADSASGPQTIDARAPAQANTVAATPAPPTSAPIPPAVNLPKWDPEADQPWPYDWEENVRSCKGSENSGVLNSRNLQLKDLTEFAKHPFCNHSDVEEAARRLVYLSCVDRLPTPGSFLEHVKAIWVTSLKSVKTESGEKPAFFVIGECQNGLAMRKVVTFAAAEANADKCWACGMYSVGEPYASGSLLVGLKRGEMRPLDLSKKRRASPALSEVPNADIPAYWK
jgi:hypothetical protein